MEADELDRITWRALDRPTLAYMTELVRTVCGDDAYLKLRAELDRLAEPWRRDKP